MEEALTEPPPISMSAFKSACEGEVPAAIKTLPRVENNFRNLGPAFAGGRPEIYKGSGKKPGYAMLLEVVW